MKKIICVGVFSIISIGLVLSVSMSAQQRREIGKLVLEDIPEIPEEIKSRLHQYQNTRSAAFADWIPGNEGILISTRFGNTSQLHTVSHPGGARNQITFFDEPVGSCIFCPSSDYNRFLFTKDIGGNEFDQIYWFDMNARRSELLSDGESVNMGIVWSNKGDRFAFTSTRRNKIDFDVYVSGMSSPKEASLKINRGGGYWIVTDWSPDDRKLLVLQYISSTKANSFILELESGELTQINDPGEEAVFVALKWDKAGENIYILSDQGREFSTLGLYHTGTGRMEYLTENIPWNVSGFATNTDRSTAAFTVNENGFSRLYRMDLNSGSY
jgi:Tol biopolymer transport system component